MFHIFKLLIYFICGPGFGRLSGGVENVYGSGSRAAACGQGSLGAPYMRISLAENPFPAAVITRTCGLALKICIPESSFTM